MSGHLLLGLAHLEASNNTPPFLPTSFLEVQAEPNADEVPSFSRRTARAAMPCVFDPCGLDPS